MFVCCLNVLLWFVCDLMCDVVRLVFVLWCCCVLLCVLFCVILYDLLI